VTDVQTGLSVGKKTDRIPVVYTTFCQDTDLIYYDDKFQCE